MTTRTSTLLLAALVSMMALMIALGGCGGGDKAPAAPKLYVQTALDVEGPWTAPTITNDAVTVSSPFIRVLVAADGDSLNAMTVRNMVTGTNASYVAGEIVSWPAGSWLFHANVNSGGTLSELNLTLTIAPTQLTDFSIAVMAGGGYEQIVPDVLGIPRVEAGQEVYFWVGGAVYEIRTMGGFGAIGGAMGEGTIAGSFYRNTAAGRQDPSYIPVTIPFTQGSYAYNMYHPENGDYLVTASFPFEGRTETTAPLHFTVGPYSLGE